jgi:hypothetical protein
VLLAPLDEPEGVLGTGPAVGDIDLPQLADLHLVGEQHDVAGVKVEVRRGFHPVGRRSPVAHRVDLCGDQRRAGVQGQLHCGALRVAHCVLARLEVEDHRAAFVAGDPVEPADDCVLRPNSEALDVLGQDLDVVVLDRPLPGRRVLALLVGQQLAVGVGQLGRPVPLGAAMGGVVRAGDLQGVFTDLSTASLFSGSTAIRSMSRGSSISPIATWRLRHWSSAKLSGAIFATAVTLLARRPLSM